MKTLNRIILICCLSFCSFVLAMDLDQQLIEAALNGKAEQVQHLLTAGAHVGVGDKDGRTPLHYAVWTENKSIVKILIDNRADVNATDGFGFTPLHKAALNVEEDVTSLLLDHNADVTAKDCGYTPLFKAQVKNRKAVVKLITRWPKYHKLLQNSRKKNLAFCRAQHSPNSPASLLPNELFYYICELAKPTIEEVDKKAVQQSSKSRCSIQ